MCRGVVTVTKHHCLVNTAAIKKKHRIKIRRFFNIRNRLAYQNTKEILATPDSPHNLLTGPVARLIT